MKAKSSCCCHIALLSSCCKLIRTLPKPDSPLCGGKWHVASGKRQVASSTKLAEIARLSHPLRPSRLAPLVDCNLPCVLQFQYVHFSVRLCQLSRHTCPHPCLPDCQIYRTRPKVFLHLIYKQQTRATPTYS